MARSDTTTGLPPGYFASWTPVSAEPGHPLAVLDGEELAGGRLRVVLGRTSRFGARYFALLLEDAGGRCSREAVLTGLFRSGPLPSYNWVEVAETNQRVSCGGGGVNLGPDALERLFALLVALLPAGGHLMVEYDSAEREETARALAHNVPPIATPLGELLFRAGCGAHFKDWQIAEGGSEGPRKLQAYKPLADEHAERWRNEAAGELEAFLAQPAAGSAADAAARERARSLLPRLRG